MSTRSELRLVTGDGLRSVVVRADPDSPIRDVGTAIQQAFQTTEVAAVDGVPLVGMAPFGSLSIAEGSTIDWVPASSLDGDVGLAVVCTAGADAGRSWPVVGSELFIGRDDECEVAVADQSVSRRHTRLSVHDTGVVVEDMGSTNGTLLNGERLGEPQWVRAGDHIRVGMTVLEITAVTPEPLETGAPEPRAGAGPRLCVVGGLAAGQSFDFDTPTMIVGRSPRVHASVDDALLSAQHFRLELGSDRLLIEDLDSSNGTTVDGQPIDDKVWLEPGSLIRAGDHLFTVRPPAVADAVLGAVEGGRRRYDRSARIRAHPPTPKITVPTEPTEADKPAFPWPIVIAPLLLSVVMAFVFKRPEALLFSLLTPVMAVSTNLSYRRTAARRNERETADYEAALAEMDRSVAAAVRQQTTHHWSQAPDPTQVADIASGPGARLWERRTSDADTLAVRIGSAAAPADIDLVGPSDAVPPDMANVPVSVDLEAAGVTSLAGDPDQIRPLARWILAQLVALVSPADLSIGVLTQPEAADDWSSMGWVPHARLGDANGVRIGNDAQTIEARVGALTANLAERQELKAEHRIDVFSPLILTVIDNSREFRRVPGVLRLLEEGPAVGMLFLTLDHDTNRTPGEARALVAFDSARTGHCRLEVAGRQPRASILSEGVSADWLFDVARSTAAIEPATDEAAAQIPSLVRFADLAGIDVDDDSPLFAAWSAGARTCDAIIGATAEGPFSVDIARDGPHAFLAGTTGSGKTELLLTFMMSLALGNRPEALNIIVVDWKGGGDFVELGALPHTVGMVTNLDGHLAKRALASLQAEVERRQNLLKELKEAGRITESNLASAWDEHPETARELGLARLVIVVDEFAELAQSLPEFLAGLVRIARVGRALGIHLVLATQRPRGVITGDLAANVGLRLVLRTESGESREVLESDHADHISRRARGRGFVRYGDPPRLVEFQTARVAGRRPGVATGLPAPIVDIVGWADLGYALPSPPSVDDQPDADSTDLRALVDMTQRVAQAIGAATPTSPWLPPLPASIELSELAGRTPPTGGRGSMAAPFGLIDEPSAQRQMPIVFDLEHHGHLAVAGSAGSGRTTTLRTLAASLAANVSAADCNIYGFDFGNGGLLALSDLPHVGAIVRSNEADRVARVLERLSDEVTRRQGVLAKLHAANIADQRTLDPHNALPHIVVLIDRWDSFTAHYPLDTQPHQAVQRLARDGLGVGLHLVMSGDRYLLGGRMGGEFERKLILPFADRDDYRDGRLRPQDLPQVIPPGRAFLADSGAEVQIAALGADDSGPVLRERIGAIAQIGAAPDEARPTQQLIRVEALPMAISFDEVWPQLNPARLTSPLTALIGVGGDDLSPELVEFAEVGPGFTIAGPPGSGRSTALVALARSVLANGASVVAVTPRNSPLTSLVSDSLQFVAPTDLDADDLAYRFGIGSTLFVVDDVHLLSADQSMLLRGVVDGFSVGADFGFAVAGDIDKLSLLPLALGARQSGSGLLLSPRNLDRDLLSLASLPPSIIGAHPPGRGFLARRSNGRDVQVVM